MWTSQNIVLSVTLIFFEYGTNLVILYVRLWYAPLPTPATSTTDECLHEEAVFDVSFHVMVVNWMMTVVQ